MAASSMGRRGSWSLRRLGFRFCLRSFLFFVLAAGVGAAWVGIKIRQAVRQRYSVNLIRELGGSYSYDSKGRNDIVTPPEWLRQILGTDLFVNLVFADLKATAITDAELEHLSGLPYLATLWLDDTQITDAGLEHIGTLRHLRGLSLSGTKISDTGLVHLANLTKLDLLDLSDTHITDAGLASLSRISELTLLGVNGTQVTSDGLAKLQRALPGCSIMSTTEYISPQNKVRDRPGAEPTGPFRLIGRLGEPVGTVLTVQGVVVESPIKGCEAGPELRIQRINGRATQDDIQIRLSPFLRKFGEPAGEGDRLPELDCGQTYEFEGYESGQFLGVPVEAYRRAPVTRQESVFYFSHRLVVYSGKRTEPIDWSPGDFVDREALIEGRAVCHEGRAHIAAGDWRLLVNSEAPWPADLQDKTVEGVGTIRASHSPNTYTLENGTTRLVNLQDQIGRRVALRGRMWCVNGSWWFEYRGNGLYVEDVEQMHQWSLDLQGRPILISGVLDEAMLPSLDQVRYGGISFPELKKHFIVRKPWWKPIAALWAPERIER